jgi:hypothetical protein
LELWGDNAVVTQQLHWPIGFVETRLK